MCPSRSRKKLKQQNPTPPPLPPRKGKRKINERKRNEQTTYQGKINSLTSRPSPPLWYAHLSTDTTNWSSLVTHPVNGYVSTRFAFVETGCHHTSSELMVIYVFNPRNWGIMDKGLVTGVNMIDSNLHFNGFVRIKHVRLETDYFTMGVPQWWNVWHVTTTALKWKSCYKDTKLNRHKWLL